MSTRWIRLIAWSAAVLAILVTLTLVVDELTNAGQRRWWAAHPLTTDTVAGMLVLLVTVLVVNQLLNRRQARQRGHAVAAQAAILVAQATRAAKAVSAAIDGSGDRDAAMAVNEPGLGSSADGKGEEGVDRSFERAGTPVYLGE